MLQSPYFFFDVVYLHNGVEEQGDETSWRVSEGDRTVTGSHGELGPKLHHQGIGLHHLHLQNDFVVLCQLIPAGFDHSVRRCTLSCDFSGSMLLHFRPINK